MRQPPTYTGRMKKRVVDLTADELDVLASEAWQQAAAEALRRKAPVFGREGGHLVRTWPDGRKEVVAEAELPTDPLGSIDPSPGTGRGRKARQTA